MTTDFSAPGLAWSPGQAIASSPSEPPAPFHWRTFKLPASDPDVAIYGADGVMGWELKLDDLRAGYLQVGDFARGANLYDGDYRSTASSSLDIRFRRHLLLPNRLKLQSLGVANIWPLFWCNLGTQLFLATGSTANHCLFTETSGSDATLVEIPLTPTQVISSLAPIIIGGPAQPQQLMVGREGAPPLVVPTSGGAGTVMHSDLTSCWGMLTSPINAATPGTGTNLFYANGALWGLPITAAITDQPSKLQSNWPNGGYAIGINKMPKGDFGLRAFWARPLQDSVHSALGSIGVPSLPAPLEIIHTNLEGGDPVRVEIDIEYILWAVIWNHQLVVADASRIVIWDGDTSLDTQVLSGRPPNSAMKYQVSGIGVHGGALITTIFRLDLDAALSNTFPGQCAWTFEQYEPQFGSWLNISSDWAAHGAFQVGFYYGGTYDRSPSFPSINAFNNTPNLPISNLTGFLQLSLNTAGWGRMFLPPFGQNPFTLYRQTGSLQQVSQEYESPGTWTSPFFELPQLEGRWKKADTVVFMGDVDAGGAGSTVGVQLNGGTPIQFVTGIVGGTQVAQTSDTGDDALWMQLQVAIILTRAGNPMRTPNGLPVLIRGRAYLTDPTATVAGVPPGP